MRNRLFSSNERARKNVLFKKELSDTSKLIIGNRNTDNAALIRVQHNGKYRYFNSPTQRNQLISDVPYYSNVHPGKDTIIKWLHDLGFRGIREYAFITREGKNVTVKNE